MSFVREVLVLSVIAIVVVRRGKNFYGDFVVPAVVGALTVVIRVNVLDKGAGRILWLW